MITFQEFMLTSKHFCLIRSDIPFRLIANPNGGDLLSGTDVCNLPAGSFTFDFFKLLPEKYFKNNPAFKLGLAYDADLLVDGRQIDVSYSDLDYGTGVAGLAGSSESSLAEIVLIDTLISNNLQTVLSVFNEDIKGFNKYFYYRSPNSFSSGENNLNDVFNSLYLGKPRTFSCTGVLNTGNYCVFLDKGVCFVYNGFIFWRFYGYAFYSGSSGEKRDFIEFTVSGNDGSWALQTLNLSTNMPYGAELDVYSVFLTF